MTGHHPPLLALLLPVALLVAYDALVHYVSTFPDAAAWAIAITLLPATGLGLALLARRCGRRAALLAGSAVALAAGLSWPVLTRLGGQLSLLYLTQYLGTNLALATYFGRTLSGGRVPACTGFAALLQPRMSERVARYTRRLTLAWTLFFLLSALVSILLYALAPAEVWSVFSNLLYLPSVALMFVVEGLVRRLVLPPEERSGILDSIRAYLASTRPADTAAPVTPVSGKPIGQ